MKFLLFLWTLNVSLQSAQECEERDIRITNTSVTTNGNTYSIAGGLQMCVDNKWGTVCQSRWGEMMLLWLVDNLDLIMLKVS